MFAAQTGMMTSKTAVSTITQIITSCSKNIHSKQSNVPTPDKKRKTLSNIETTAICVSETDNTVWKDLGAGSSIPAKSSPRCVRK